MKMKNGAGSGTRTCRRARLEIGSGCTISCIPSLFLERRLNPNFKTRVPALSSTVEALRKLKAAAAAFSMAMAKPRISAACALDGESSGYSSGSGTVPRCRRMAGINGRRRWPASLYQTLGDDSARRRWW